MAIGDPVQDALLDGHRNGVLVEGHGEFYSRQSTRTRRGARRRFSQIVDGLPDQLFLAGVEPGDDLLITRIEQRVVAEQRHIRVPGEPPAGSGVREPRRPGPAHGGAAAALAPEDNE